MEERFRTESEAFQLANIFLKFYKLKTLKRFKLSNVKITKWWPFFIKTIEKYSNKPEWDIYNFIASQFTEGIIFPSQLPSEKAWNKYLEYRHRFENNLEKDLVRELLVTFNEIKKWSKENGYSFINCREYLKDEKNQFFIRRGDIHPLFLTFCKTFYEVFSTEEIEGIIPHIENKKAIINSKKNIYEKIKEVIGEEFVQISL